MHSRGGLKFFLTILAGGLSGCAVGPDYFIPSIGAPSTFSTGSITGATGSSPVSLTQSESPAILKWWQLLKDPELESLIDRAIVANPDIEIASDHILAARANEVAVRGLGLPTVEANAAAGRGTGTNSTKGRVAGPLNAGTNTTGLKEITHVAGFDAAWELDFFGRNRRAYEAAQYSTDVAVEQRRAVLVSVVAEVARAYVETRGIQARIKASKENVARAQKTFDLMKTRFERGLTNELDFKLASRQLATLKAELAPLSADQYAGCARIAVLLATYSGGICQELAISRNIPRTPERLTTGLPVDIIRRRPDVRAAERLLAVETARVGIAVADLFPRVEITAGGGLQGQGIGVVPIVTKGIYSVGPSLYWPLLDFGTLDSLVQIQQLQANEQFLNYKRVVLSSVEEANVALSRYSAAMATLESLAEAVKESKSAVDLSTERYDRGVTDSLYVLDAERQEDELELQYVQARTNAAVTFIAVYKALGGGWEMFDPDLPVPHPHPAVLAAFEHLHDH
ncbi:efflux transporter outer membrane subunit [Hyphomicrobium sp.]|jgi:NodT family efflux transporter outer membrane factor (OMF) lipoprotein|uniref:efflux transporter outer membrane subunit n=1 Tax=Hyphomicrobium sp. TaxID=82 RepID=UPI0035678A4E